MNERAKAVLRELEAELLQADLNCKEADVLEAAAKRHREKMVAVYHLVNNAVLALRELVKPSSAGGVQ